MRKLSCPRVRSICLIGGGALLGFGLGFACRTLPPDRFEKTTTSQTVATSGARQHLSVATESMVMSRKSAASESLAFSREQWKQLLRKGRVHVVDLSECLRWQRRKEVPFGLLESEKKWGFDGVVLELEEGGPDLEPVARFLGLDDARTLKLRDCLKRFGEDLRRVEQEHAEIAYAGDGTARISFGEGAAVRDSLLPGLKEELIAALGERDGARFAAVSGLFEEGTLPREIVIEFEMNDQFVRSEVKGSMELIMFLPVPEGEIPGEKEHQPRLGHLGVGIDWARLFEEAKVNAAP